MRSLGGLQLFVKSAGLMAVNVFAVLNDHFSCDSGTVPVPFSMLVGISWPIQVSRSALLLPALGTGLAGLSCYAISETRRST